MATASPTPHSALAGGGTARRVAATIAVWLLLVAFFAWPLMANHGAIWFHDSVAYLLQPANAVAELFGWKSSLLAEAPAAADGAGDGAAGGDDAKQAGRSIYYGMATFVAFEAAGGVGVALAQSGLFAAVLMAALWPWLAGPRGGLLAVGAAVAALTAAPFFTNYIMPDFLAGITILAGARLLAGPPTGRGALAIWWAVLAYALVAHTSHVLIALGLLLCALAVLPACGLRAPVRGAALTGIALTAALALEFVFAAVVERIYGAPPLRPPFVAARVIADGPGYAWLEENCPEAGFELCNHLDRLPASVGEIIWTPDPEVGIYGAAGTEVRRRLAEEHYAFVLAVLADKPLAQLRASGMRFLEQLQRFGITHFAYPDGLKETLSEVLAGEGFARIRASAIYQERFPLQALTQLQQAAVAAGLVVLAVAALAPPRRGAAPPPSRAARRFRAFAVLVVLGVLGNAAITGMLSAPAARYQARVVWLVPMLAAVVLWRRYRGAPAEAA